MCKTKPIRNQRKAGYRLWLNRIRPSRRVENEANPRRVVRFPTQKRVTSGQSIAACQGTSELRTHAPLTASGYDAERENDRFQPAASQGESHGPEWSLHRPPREGGAVPVEDPHELPRGHAGRWPDLRRRSAHRTDQARPG